MDLQWRERGSVGVCIFVVVTREVVECSEGTRCVGVVGDTVFAGAIEVVFQCVDSGFVVLLTWISSV